MTPNPLLFLTTRLGIILSILLVVGGRSSAKLRAEQSTEKNALVAVEVEPHVIPIHGVGNTHRVLFTGILSDGDRVDLTSQARVSIENPQRVQQVAPGLFKALDEGISKITMNWGKQQAEAVIVVEPARNVKIDFTTQVAPVFSKYGCNSTNCHGALNGQSGFKLSLFGYDPDLDYDAVMHSSGGRRINQ